MKSSSKVLLIALAFSAYCCSPKGDGSATVDVEDSKMAVMSLDELKSDEVIVPLSSLVENCELVQLETREDAYFKAWFTTVTDKYIGIRVEGNELFKLFARSGKFLCNVGSIGQGPGEYTIGPYDAIIDDQNELIYLAPFMGNKILVYNTSGLFVKDIVAPHGLNKAKIFLSDDILTVIHMPFQDDRAMAFQFDVNTGEVLKELAPSAHFFIESFDSDMINTRNAPEIFDFASVENDTLYHYDMKNNKILPAFKMTYSSSEKPWLVYFQISKDLILTNVSFLETTPTGEKYVPNGLVATNLKSQTSSYINVVNDYFGNIPVKVSYFTFFHGHYILNIQPEELMENIEEHLSKSGCTESDKQILQKTLSTLKEGTNNVVFIGKLKLAPDKL